MLSHAAQVVHILGLTKTGKTFRPSDWAERLAGVMSQFHPRGGRLGGHMAYSPWCVPTALDGVKCVRVHPDLKAFEPMAWDFCMNFARDNNLQLRFAGVNEGAASDTET